MDKHINGPKKSWYRSEVRLVNNLLKALLRDNTLSFENSRSSRQFWYILHTPLTTNLSSKHSTSFRGCNNVVDVQTTLYQRQNDVVALTGYRPIFLIFSMKKGHTTLKCQNVILTLEQRLKDIMWLLGYWWMLEVLILLFAFFSGHFLNHNGCITYAVYKLDFTMNALSVYY